MKTNIRQHQPLRVPQGWTEQDRALVIQLEKLFDEVYAITSKLQETVSEKADKSAAVSAVDYDTDYKKITKTIDGTTTDVVSVSTIKSALGSFTWGELAGE